MSAMRTRTSASRTWGSTLLSLVVVIRAVDESGALATAVGAGKEPCLSPESVAPQRAFGGVVREAGAAVIEEGRDARPPAKHVVHRLGEGGVTGQAGTLVAHPPLEIRDHRRDHLEARAHAGAIDGALGIEDRIDVTDGLQRQRRDRWRGLCASRARGDVGQLVELASRMRPAERGHDRSRAAISGIETFEAGIGRPLAKCLTSLRGGVPDACRAGRKGSGTALPAGLARQRDGRRARKPTAAPSASGLSPARAPGCHPLPGRRLRNNLPGGAHGATSGLDGSGRQRRSVNGAMDIAHVPPRPSRATTARTC